MVFHQGGNGCNAPITTYPRGLTAREDEPGADQGQPEQQGTDQPEGHGAPVYFGRFYEVPFPLQLPHDFPPCEEWRERYELVLVAQRETTGTDLLGVKANRKISPLLRRWRC